MQQAKDVARASKRMGKKVMATDTAQDVVGVVVDGLEEVTVDKADDLAEDLKVRAARAGGRSPKRSARKKSTARKSAAKKSTAKSGPRSPRLGRAPQNPRLGRAAAKKSTARKSTAKKSRLGRAPRRSPRSRRPRRSGRVPRGHSSKKNAAKRR